MYTSVYCRTYRGYSRNTTVMKTEPVFVYCIQIIYEASLRKSTGTRNEPKWKEKRMADGTRTQNWWQKVVGLAKRKSEGGKIPHAIESNERENYGKMRGWHDRRLRIATTSRLPAAKRQRFFGRIFFRFFLMCCVSFYWWYTPDLVVIER